MRIGIDCRTYWSHSGYIGKYIESFVSYLQENIDHNEYILFFNDREFSEFTSKSTHIRAIKTSTKKRSLSGQVIFPYELRKEKLNVMLFPYPNIPFLYFKKSIVIVSDLVSYFYPEKHLKTSWMRHWWNFVLRNSFYKASSIITLNEVLKRDMIEIFDIHEEKISVFPPMHFETKIGWKNEEQQFLRKENLNGKYILSVWELREYKNIPRLLQAYNLLLKEDALDIDLVLVWKEDPTYHEIRSTLIGLGLQTRVHIYNVLNEEEIGFLYQNASLYVLPSIYEWSEQTLLSSFAYNLPLASALLPSITPILGKDNASFFRPMSVPDIHEALKKGLSSPLKKITKDMTLFGVPVISKKIQSIFDLYKGAEEKPEKEEN